MVIAPFVLGMLAAGFDPVHLPLAVFWLGGYFAFFATSLWLKSRRRAKYFPPVRAYGLLTTVAGGLVVLWRPDLLVWAPGFAVPLAVGLWAAARRRERDLLVGLTTVLGSSWMALVAYAAGAGPGEGGPTALSVAASGRPWLLAAVQAAYFAGTVFYVKSVIRERGNVAFFRLSIAYHLACVVVLAVWALGLPASASAPVEPTRWWLVVVFALLAARAAAVWLLDRQGRRLSPAKIGLGELLATLVVGIVSLVAI